MYHVPSGGVLSMGKAEQHHESGKQWWEAIKFGRGLRPAKVREGGGSPSSGGTSFVDPNSEGRDTKNGAGPKIRLTSGGAGKGAGMDSQC